MQTILIVIHLLIVITLVSIILLQHSEDGGLGARSNANFMSVRGKKNALTRLTAILAGAFFLTSLALLVVNDLQNPTKSVLREITTNKNVEQKKVVSALPVAPSEKSVPAAQKTSADGAQNNPAGAPKANPAANQSVKPKEIVIPKITVQDIAPGSVTPMVGHSSEKSAAAHINKEVKAAVQQEKEAVERKLKEQALPTGAK